MLPGSFWMLLVATCAGWLCVQAVVSRAEEGTQQTCEHQMLHRACDLSLSLSSLSLMLSFTTSTFTSLLSVCQHFPSGSVRHGVRVPGLPVSASTHCDLQPRHFSSTCQCHSRSPLGVYTESAPRAKRRVLVVLNRSSYCSSFAEIEACFL